MNFDLSSEQKLLKEHLRHLLADLAAPEKLRAVLASEQPWDPILWRELAAAGFLGAAIPEEFGGVGMGDIDLCVIAEEIGRCVAPVPFFSSVCQAAEAIRRFGSADQKRRYLPVLASGEAIGTLAHHEGHNSSMRAMPRAILRDGRLTGVKWPVADAGVASLCIVTAVDDSGHLCMAMLNLDQPTIVRRLLKGHDQLRPHYRLEFSGADAEKIEIVDPHAGFAKLICRTAVFVAFEQLGGADACLEMATAYSQSRYTFGRPIGSNQAIKHALADGVVKNELARSNGYYAAWALASESSELPLAAATARVSATEAFDYISRENLQVHGGIGYTWEANCHFYYRRARLLGLNLDGTEVWSARLIEQLKSRAEG